MLKLHTALLLALLLFVPSITAAQDASPQRFTMQRIVFKGTHAFTDEQLLNALGMKVGASYTQQDLLDAANKLANVGVFTQVSYRFSPDSAEFFLTDNQNLVPIQFNNCVWMTDEEVLTALKQRVPFFGGTVPEEGALTETVGKQIEVVLAEKGVKAKVQYMPATDKDAVKAVTYTMIDPRIEVAVVHFTGASAKITNALDEASKGIVGKEYTRSFFPGAADKFLKPVLQESGYLRGYIGEPSFKLISAASEPIAKLELTVPVQEGPQYRLAALSMKGDNSIARDAAKRLSAFKTGDVINMTMFRRELARLAPAYLAAGHMNAKVRAEPTFDETVHTVSYDIELVPGEVYKLSKLDLQGLDDAQKTKLLQVWKLKVGDVYDPTYAPKFLAENQAKLRFLDGYSLAWTQKLYDDTNTVELFVFFRRPGSGAR